MVVIISVVGVFRCRWCYSFFICQDKIVFGFVVGILVFIYIFLVWILMIFLVILLFMSWNGIGGFDKIKFVGV